MIRVRRMQNQKLKGSAFSTVIGFGCHRMSWGYQMLAFWLLNLLNIKQWSMKRNYCKSLWIAARFCINEVFRKGVPFCSPCPPESVPALPLMQLRTTRILPKPHKLWRMFVMLGWSWRIGFVKHTKGVMVFLMRSAFLLGRVGVSLRLWRDAGGQIQMRRALLLWFLTVWTFWRRLAFWIALHQSLSSWKSIFKWRSGFKTSNAIEA